MTEDTRPIVLTGGCQCGAVRYALFAPTVEVSVCHCRMCQKAVGGPFAALAKIPLADFAWTRGAPSTFHSSTAAARDFCAGCGTPLSFRYPDGAWIELTVGSLDHPQAAPPVRQFGIEGKLAWLDTLAALPASMTEATMPPERRARLVSRQHPDHETPESWTPPR